MRGPSALYRVAKRSVDVVVAGLLSVATLPVVALLAVGGWLSFRANPFFVQLRPGLGGQPIRVIKLRSLPVTANPTADKYELQGVPNTRFGSFLRGTHLDELPQLWMTVIGTMSLVGPRPEMAHLAEQFGESQRAAHRVCKPGVTGLWQISESAPRLMSEAPEYDIFYARNSGPPLDAWILWRTVRLCLGGERGVRLDDIPTWAGGGQDRTARAKSAAAGERSTSSTCELRADGGR